jgi:preprotein translocase subunit SecA
MFKNLIRKLFGTKIERDVKRLRPIVARIRAFEEEFSELSEAGLRAKTQEFRDRLQEGEETLDDLLPEAFGAVCAACQKLRGKKWMAAGNEIEWDMVPFDVQLMGGIGLHEGKIAEMATGEGKTLVAVAPLYLNALTGKGAHLVTVNDYLAKRDAEWMGPVFQTLGMTVGVILTNLEPSVRREAYASDVTYGTNNEFGFDYLRDNMSHWKESLVQRGFHYAIIDEVDSVLIDESRTPLIIAGQIERDQTQYVRMKAGIEKLYSLQTKLANQLVSEARELLDQLEANPNMPRAEREQIERAVGTKLLQVEKGQPKNSKLRKLVQEVRYVKMKERAERDIMLDKLMRDVEEELYFVIDEKSHGIDLTDKGREALAPKNPDMFVLSDIIDEIAKIEADSKLSDEEKIKAKEDARITHEKRQEELHAISQLLRAYTLYHKDVEYVVEEDKVVIVDEHTGRKMSGRRWSDGLHSAVEAKEGVQMEKETRTLATITLQNFFRMYEKLAGMTGTAETEAQEFSFTYGMDVMVVATNKPIIREDLDDLIYKTKREKYTAILDEVERLHKANLPVLVGTKSVEISELLSKMLVRRKIPHNVLNAKYHQREAEIIRDAGQAGQVTIATNMAGRGTDIKLGKGVVHRDEDGHLIGGLQIVGTERHDARRIDRQLRGRAGRQGDPGASRFFLSLEDDLMRLFQSDRITKVMEWLKMEEGEPIEHNLVTRAISNAQKKVEQRNFEIRKRLLEYDDVANKQRTAIYQMRRDALMAEDVETLKPIILDMCLAACEAVFADLGNNPNSKPSAWDLDGLYRYLERYCPYAKFSDIEISGNADTSYDELFDALDKRLEQAFQRKLQTLGDDIFTTLGKRIILSTIDADWQDHLEAIDNLRDNIWMAGFAQKEPLSEFKREASEFYNEMLDNIQKEVFQHFFLTQVIIRQDDRSLRLNFQKQTVEEFQQKVAQSQAAQAAAQQAAHRVATAEPAMAGVAASSDDDEGEGSGGEAPAPRPKIQPVRRTQPKVGRNDPCPCGSGRKYKQCCGRGK